jgi:hypothetical protein
MLGQFPAYHTRDVRTYCVTGLRALLKFPHVEVGVRDNSAVVPVRRRRSIFSIIGMVVVALVLAVVAYFAWVGWSERGRPVPDVDVKTTSSAVDVPPAPADSAPAVGTVRT